MLWWLAPAVLFLFPVVFVSLRGERRTKADSADASSTTLTTPLRENRISRYVWGAQEFSRPNIRIPRAMTRGKRAQDNQMRCLTPLLALLTTNAAHASQPPSPSALCDAAILGAERTAHLPLRLLGAIAEVESGRLDPVGHLRPWPWSIDAEGRGQFFASKQEAIAAVQALQAQGVQSIDVGCMQVNLMHHPNAFATLDQAFDPTANAQYAARFLNTLYGINGSWLQATAAYHSQTPAIGAEYQQRVVARWHHPGGFGAILTQTTYGDFKPERRAYGAFQPADRVYGAFADPVSVATSLAHR